MQAQIGPQQQLENRKTAWAASIDWSTEAPTWAQKCWPDVEHYYNLVDTVQLHPDDLVLDMACGVSHIGALAAEVQGSPKNVYFCDQNAAMLDQAKKNMVAIHGGEVLRTKHFVLANLAQTELILKSTGVTDGFDVVFGKGLMRLFRWEEQPEVWRALARLCKDTGLIVCDVPQPAPSRGLVFTDPSALTCMYASTLVMAASDSCFPNDLAGVVKNQQFTAIESEMFMDNKTCLKYEAEVKKLVDSSAQGPGGVSVQKMLTSTANSRIQKITDGSRAIWDRAVHRTSFADQSLSVRVDISRRERLQSLRTNVGWGHRLVEHPLSTNVVAQKLVTRKLSDIVRKLPPSEACQKGREHRKAI